MAKKVRAIVKIQISAGKATPAPPVGPALGSEDFGESALYSAGYDRRFRPNGRQA